MAVDHNNPQSRDEEILIATIDGTEYNKLPQSRMEELLLELKEVIEEGGGGGGTTDYENLSNQPQVNGETLIGDKSGADLGLVDAEEGKGLSTNDYDDTEKAAVAAATSAISAMKDGSDIDSFGDVEVALLDKQDELTAGKYIQITNDEISVKRDIAYESDEVFFAEQTNKGLHVSVTIGSTTLYDENFVTSDPNHTVLDLVQTSFSVRAVRWVVKYLKASKTRSAGTEETVWPSLTDTFVTTVDADKKLIIQSEMDAAINSAVSKCYHHAGTKTCAELLPALLIAANEGNVYEMTDSGTTTSDFMEGIGHPIKEGDNVGVARVSEGVYKFDLLSGFVDTSNFVQKSETSGLLKNDGTVDTTIQGDVSTLKSGLTNLDNEVNGDATVYPYADVITIDDAVPSNLADCKVKIEPVQSGSGDPSPTNIRPITGHTEASVQRDGKNLFPDTMTWELGAYGNAGNKISAEDRVRTESGIAVRPNTQYTISFASQHSLARICKYDSNGGFIGVVYTTTFTTDANCGIITITVGTTNTNVLCQLELGSTATLYEPYQGKTYTIALGDTIYGGTVDFDSGVMMVTKAYNTVSNLSWTKYDSLDGTLFRGYISDIKAGNADTGIVTTAISSAYPSVANANRTNNTLSQAPSQVAVDIIDNDFDDAAVFKSTMGDVEICYELATPTTIQLTPQQIQLLKGQNTLTASTGQISVTVNGVSGSIGQVQEQVNELAEDVAEIDGKLDALDTYVLNTPVKIGKWFDSVLYRKVISFGALPNATYGSISSGLSNVAIVNIRAFARSANATIMLNYPDCKCYYNHSNDTVVIAASADFSSYTSCYVVLEYYEQPNS